VRSTSRPGEAPGRAENSVSGEPITAHIADAPGRGEGLIGPGSYYLSAVEQSARRKYRTLSPVEIVAALLDRIARYNDTLHSDIEVTQVSDRSRREGPIRRSPPGRRMGGINRSGAHHACASGGRRARSRALASA